MSDKIVARALAGAKRVRLGADARFSERQLRLLEIREVYQVYNFLSVAIAQGKVYRIGLLFTGKTALERIGLLSRAYEEGLLAPPRYLPPHFADLAGLGSWLAYSRFLDQIDLGRIEADYAELL